MKKCPKCGTWNNPDAFRCKNDDCSEILPQNPPEKNTHSQNMPITKPTDTSVNPKRLLKLLLGFLAVGIIMFGVMSYFSSCAKDAEKRNQEYQADLQRIAKSREAAEHAREYWGKRYEEWENSVGNPPCLKGKRGELGLTPIYYPSLGIIVIINDDNQIIHVEQK